MLLSPAPESGSAPPSPLAQLGGWVLDGALACAAGAVLGALAVRAMRRRGLHWSWAALALAIAVLARPRLGGVGPTLVVTAAWATVVGRRRHRADIESGADLADGARDRRTPRDMLEPIVRRARGGALPAVEAAQRLRGGELALGRDRRGRTVCVPFDARAGRHMLVVGATGSGKTTTQTWIAARALAAGLGAVVVDPKGDAPMRRALADAALASGRPFLEWSPHGGCVYNPYAHGTDTEIADKVLAGERFSEPHYLRLAQRYLGHVVRALRAAGVEMSLQSIVEHLEPARLELLARAPGSAAAPATHSYLDSLTARQRAELAGMRDRAAILAESDVGPWLDPRRADGPPLELAAAVRRRAVVYFCLEADRRPLLTQMLGAAIVGDLSTVVSALQGQPASTLVVIDEFSSIAAEQVVRLFARSRSAGFSLLLGTQELSDLGPPGGERLLEQVLGNLSAVIAHRQVVPHSAELLARLAGTRGAWRVSRQGGGRSTRTRIRENVIAPDQIMGLAPGSAVVIALGAGGRARVARMFAPTEHPIGGADRRGGNRDRTG